ncbi:reverse transcriptase domain-containing protein [Tanacetum coccineum]
MTTDQVLTESTIRVPPPVVQPSPTSTSSEPPPAPISSPMIPEPNPHQPLIPYPSRLNKEKLHDKADIQFIFAKMVKDLLTNKEKLLEMANTTLNKNCSAVLLKKLPIKLGDTRRFLIPCDFYGLESCMALTDLGASINLMPLSVWKTLSLPELSPTRMPRNLQYQITSMKGELKNEIQTTIKNQQTALMSQNNAFQNTLQNNLQTMLSSFFQAQASPSGTLPSNTIPNPKGEMKAITTRSGVAYEGPSNPTKPSPKKVVERETEEITDEEQNDFQGSTAQIPPPVIPKPIPEPEILKTLPKSTPIPEPEIPKTVPKANIPYPSRRDNQKNREKASYQKEKIFQMFQDLRFDISFADALVFNAKICTTIRDLLLNKENSCSYS